MIHGTHADALAKVDGAQLAGFYDVVPEKAASASEKYEVPAASSLEELFGMVDVVTVCVPSGDHATIAVQAARAGKHVLTEKPIDVTRSAAVALVEACEKANVKLGVISQHRMAPDIQRVREAAQGGELGKLVAGDAYIKWFRSQAYYDSGDWRGTWKLDGGGCLMNQGVHYVDMIQWVMGGVRSVQAMVRTSSHERIEVEDIANVLVEYSNGAVGVIQGSTSYYPGLAERIEVHGHHGTAIVEADRLKVWEVDETAASAGLYGKGLTVRPDPGFETVEDTAASSPAILPDLHLLQVEDFTRAVVDDRDPFVTGRDALAPLEVILAIYESARKGGVQIAVGLS